MNKILKVLKVCLNYYIQSNMSLGESIVIDGNVFMHQHTHTHTHTHTNNNNNNDYRNSLKFTAD